MELVIDVEADDSVKHVHLLRMFERVTWQLKNYFRFRRGFDKSQFAVPYINVEENKQVVAVYEADFMISIDGERNSANDRPAQTVNTSEWFDLSTLIHVPFVRILGVHEVD
jgi:hypothetical protein